MFNGEILYTLELKSVGTNSISFEREKTDKGVIHKHQIDNLIKFATYPNIVSGFLLDFRLSETTYFCLIDDFVEMINNIDKKSFNEKDLIKWCDPIIIKKKKLKVNYRYDVNNFLKETRLKQMNYPFICPKCGTKKIISMPITLYRSDGHYCECGTEMERTVESLVCSMAIDKTGDFYSKTTI